MAATMKLSELRVCSDSLTLIAAINNKQQMKEIVGQCRCAFSDLQIGAVRTGRQVAGQPEWKVTVVNTCNCPQKQVTLSCGGFAPVNPVKPWLLRPQGRTCLLINGEVMPAGATAEFAYAGQPYIFRPVSSRLAVVELFSLKKVHSFKNIREEEVGFMVKKVSESSLKQSPVDLNKTFFSLTASIICRVALGQNFNESGFVIEQDRIEELVRDALVALGSFTCSDVFPGGLGRLLDWLFGEHKRINKVFEELDAFYQHVIDDHLKPEAAGKKAIDSAADIVALLLDMMEKQGKKDYFKLINISNIKGVLMDLFELDDMQDATEEGKSVLGMYMYLDEAKFNRE
ncbi:hypothetical protein Bca52824_089402 [Brassica carinata]|uniref:Uncharacterized protein n=1 Tax=Brassica carinata TaxID=52824 RepID=A0A8X7PHR7_BRACI|nr:hypothetical protein Bca52824_089402 [Brassica carinata]